MQDIPRPKLIASICAIVALLIFIAVLIITAPDPESEQKQPPAQETTVSETTEITTTDTATTTIAITTIAQIESPQCKSAALYCVDDKQLLYNDNIYGKAAPASITKLLTASVALKHLSGDKVLTVGSEQSLVQPYSSLCGFSLGDSMTLKDMITGMLMASGNDAAYTIAVSVAREMLPDAGMSDSEAVDFFCGLMNVFAKDLGMENSSFVTPDGWDDDDQYTSAADLLKLAEYVLTVPEITESTKTLTKKVNMTAGGIQSWTNSNCLLDPDSEYYCKEAIGLKTGTTLSAGSSLIAAFKINGKTYISVVLGCEEDYERYELTNELIDKIR
ncbi:MAG: hypothetical protein K6G33_09875 [Ruminococcus sp.]|uniref:D-alanyl-D-alanine carboxypeptidase family protein n=1 Tax=Ruminococcus sp. TaxID=41978 RepID=UPI0025F4A277|nr:hypothetical protein [Ruminococcus sp.]MCR5601031.1 hypothetical protein [Ruminococcus sp.]